MKRLTDRLITALALTLTLTTGPVIVQAQPLQQQDDRQAVSQEFDRQTLEKYAAVSAELGKMESEVAQKLQNVQDQEKAMAIKQEATQKTISIIEAQGLDIPTYNKIAHLVSVDQELRSEIEQISKR